MDLGDNSRMTKQMQYRMTIVFYGLCILFVVALCIALTSSPKPSTEQQGEQTSDHARSTQSGNENDHATHNNINPNDWRLVLANKTHPLSEAFNVELAQFQEGQKSDTRCLDDLQAMIKAAQSDEISLFVASSYRSLERQEVLFERVLEESIDNGMTESEAYQAAAEYQAPPGTSEHATGLAFDIVDDDWFNNNENLNERFEKTQTFAWLDKHAVEYGFVLRYPKNKVEITKYAYEPWHYRYVGLEHAQKIKEQGLCLEEYINVLD